jgi:CubicO group peptidase (beta-lactamase class C family)
MQKKTIVKVAASVLAVGIASLACSWLLPWVHASKRASTSPLPRAAPEKIDHTCKQFAAATRRRPFDAYFALKGHTVVASCGMVDAPINTHSARKSILSALIGIAIARGELRLDQTLEELGIDDSLAPLSPSEKTATVRDLLTSTSGVYIEASGETSAMNSSRPQRGSAAPGTRFYYNNWDFNVLGVIFEKAAGRSIGDALYEWIATPIGMETFEPEHVLHFPSSTSEHGQYAIFMSAADMARVGQLFLQRGKWNGKQIIPEEWIAASISPLVETSDPSMQPTDHFGFSWWIDSDKGIAWAAGWGGQYMTIDPRNETIVVTRQDTGRSQAGLWKFMWTQSYRLPAQHEFVRRWTQRNVN